MAVYLDGRELYLTVGQYRAFSVLWNRRGAVVTHQEIAAAVAGLDVPPEWYRRDLAMNRSRNVIVYIRRALGDAVTITERRGVGYRLEA